VIKPDVRSSLSAVINAPEQVKAGELLTYKVNIKNSSSYALNGTQVRFPIPSGESFAGSPGSSVTLQGNEIVITVGRVLAGETQTVEIPMTVVANTQGKILAYAEVFSSTAQPVITDGTLTTVQ
jgi:uncharacterized repeat protein (TIGR01451 family)